MKAPKDTIFYLIEATIKKYRRFAQAKLQELHPTITIDQGLLLNQLINYPDATQKELSELIFKDMASISRMLAALEKNGFIVRQINAENRRRFIIEVTEKGKTVYEELKPQVLKNRAQALDGLSKEEIHLVSQVLQKIGKNISSPTNSVNEEKESTKTPKR